MPVRVRYTAIGLSDGGGGGGEWGTLSIGLF